jgi:hypothetical protein
VAFEIVVAAARLVVALTAGVSVSGQNAKKSFSQIKRQK